MQKRNGQPPTTADNCRLAREVLRQLHHDITRDIVSAFYAVKDELGLGFPEHVYANATATALSEMGRRTEREVPYEVVFHGVVVGTCRVDLLVDSVVIAEVKVARAVMPAHRAQLSHYLHAAQLNIGLVLNYGEYPGVGRVMCP